MRIGLVYCPSGSGFNTFGKTHWTSQIHPGLCLLSACAKREGFTDVELLDIRSLKSWDHFREKVRERHFDVAGITMTSCDYNNAVQAISIIKDEHKDTVIVAGGVHPTVATDEVAAIDKIDHIIVGEGDISFVNLLRDLQSGNRTERIISGLKPDLDQLPFEDRELFDYKLASRHVSNFPGIFKGPSVSLIGSRGCPYNCTFCAPHAKIMFGPKVRFRSVDHVIEELKILREKYHFNSLFFWDYSVTLNRQWMMEFCEKYKSNGFTAKISANSRADAICRNEDMIKILSEIGLVMVHIGYESGSQRILDFIQKGTTVEEYEKATEICKKYGVIIRGLFMLGIPTETKDDVQATIDLIKRIKPHIYSFSYYTPVPGSTLYEYCRERDLSLIKSHDEFGDYGPSKPKIKGIDYAYLKGVVEESFGLQFGSRTIGNLMRFIYTHTSRGKIRFIFIWLYSKWVAIKSALDPRKTL